jgi:hypothetical protein
VVEQVNLKVDVAVEVARDIVDTEDTTDVIISEAGCCFIGNSVSSRSGSYKGER